LGGVTFVILRDRTGLIQCVFERSPAAARLSCESVIAVKGLAVAEPRALSGVEVRADDLEVIAPAPGVLPFEVNTKTLRANLDLQLQERALSLRHPMTQAVFRVQAALARGFRRALETRGFLEVHTPKLVASGTEGGAELFPVRYFDRQAYLAQSPQFYKQMLVLSGFERVFEAGPVFRAENHNTTRHTNEFTSLDLEMAFIQSEEDVMVLHEQILGEMLATVAGECAAELDMLGASLPESGPIPRLPVPEAHALLRERFGWTSPPGTSGVPEINAEGERLLGDYARAELGSDLLFLTSFPTATRPAYTMPRADDPSLSRSFDLIFRGVEVTTGGQRLNDYDALVRSFRARNYDPRDFESYLNPFRFGAPPHGGMAMGLERLTERLLGLGNIRQATLFPRDRDRLTP